MEEYLSFIEGVSKHCEIGWTFELIRHTSEHPGKFLIRLLDNLGMERNRILINDINGGRKIKDPEEFVKITQDKLSSRGYKVSSCLFGIEENLTMPIRCQINKMS